VDARLTYAEILSDLRGAEALCLYPGCAGAIIPIEGKALCAMCRAWRFDDARHHLRHTHNVKPDHLCEAIFVKPSRVCRRPSTMPAIYLTRATALGRFATGIGEFIHCAFIAIGNASVLTTVAHTHCIHLRPFLLRCTMQHSLQRYDRFLGYPSITSGLHV
jgi:hypothetical protein